MATLADAWEGFQALKSKNEAYAGMDPEGGSLPADYFERGYFGDESAPVSRQYVTPDAGAFLRSKGWFSPQFVDMRNYSGWEAQLPTLTGGNMAPETVSGTGRGGMGGVRAYRMDPKFEDESAFASLISPYHQKEGGPISRAFSTLSGGRLLGVDPKLTDKLFQVATLTDVDALDKNINWIAPVMLAVMGGYALAGASGLIAAEAAPALEGVAMTAEAAAVTTEAVPLAASEFSLAGSGSGAGIGGGSYGLGLSVPAAAPGVAVSEFSLAGGVSGYGLAGNAALSAPALASSGFTIADALKQGQAFKSAASQVLSIGRAVRSALAAGDAAPGGGPVFAPAADTTESDIAWTLGTLVAAAAAVFLYSKM